MTALGHLIFEIIKISILSWLYSFVVCWLIKSIGNKNPDTWFNRISQSPRKLRRNSAKCIAVFFFIYMFTYWGDHGLGDEARIPLGHGAAVEASDSEFVYFESPTGQQQIGKFSFDSNYLYAEYRSSPKNPYPDFLIWNLRSKRVAFYPHQTYLSGVAKHQFPVPLSFEKFNDNYDKYWSSWRLFLLP